MSGPPPSAWRAQAGTEYVEEQRTPRPGTGWTDRPVVNNGPDASSPLWKKSAGRSGEKTRFLGAVDSSRVREGSDILSKVIKEDAGRNLHMDDLEKAFRVQNSSTKCSFQQPGWPQTVRIVNNTASAQLGITALPDVIREKYNVSLAAGSGEISGSNAGDAHQPVVCLTGLFPSIRRAWATVDNAVFIWKFDSETDPNVVQYEGQEQAISAVALAPVKPGVFWEAIQHVLVICTSVEVTLVGIVMQSKGGRGGYGSLESSYESMNLQPLPLYSVSTDTVMMSSICATSEGRIFLGGENGHIYELSYSVGDNWRNKRCSLVCHSKNLLNMVIPTFLRGAPSPVEQLIIDEERGIMYARTRASTIQVFDLGEDRRANPKKVAEISDIIDAARRGGPNGLGRQLFARESGNSYSRTSTTKPTDLVHIAILDKSASQNLHLVGIMGDGRRLFLSTFSYGYYNGRTTPRPSELRVKYVMRAPDRPPFGSHKGVFGVGSPHRSHSESLVVEYAFCKEGLYLFSCEADDHSHTQLLLTSKDFTLGANAEGTNDIVESVTMELIRGHVCAIAEMEPPEVLKQTVQVKGDLYGDLSEVLHSAMLPAKRFSLVSTSGTLIVEKLRPVDLLQNLVESGNRDHIRNFFQNYGLAESACMCLIFAASVVRSNSADADFWLDELKSSFGLEADEAAAVMQVIAKSPFVIEEARKVFSDPDFTGRPVQEDDSLGEISTPVASTFDMGGPREPKIKFSARLDGFALLAARLLRPVWDIGVFSIDARGSKVEYGLAMNTKSMRLLEERISSLVQYMIEFTHHQEYILSEDSRGYISENGRRTRQKVEIAMAKEQSCITSLCSLLQRCYETLKMLRMLQEKTNGNLALLVNRLEGPPRDFFSLSGKSSGRKGTLHELVVMDEGDNLMRSLVSALMSYKMDVSSGAIHLKEISSELEATCPTLFQSEDRIFYDARMSLRSARKASGAERNELIQNALKMLLQVPLVVNIYAVFSELIDLKAYQGAVDLVIQAAAMRDPRNIALQNDARKEDYQRVREECYVLVIEVLTQLKTSSMTEVALTSSPLSASKAESESHQAMKTYTKILSHCMSSNDICFHKYLYNQLMSMGPEAQNDLIQQNPAYLEEFLREQAGLSAGPAPIHTIVKKLPALMPKAVDALEVLGRLYVHRHMFSHAAYLQLLLGERLNVSEGDPSFVSLEKRQQHLLDAMRLAKSRSQHQGLQSPDSEGFSNSLLDALQCKVEIIAFQIRLVDSLTSKASSCESELMQVGGEYNIPRQSIDRLTELVNKGVHENISMLIQTELGNLITADGQERLTQLLTSYAGYAMKTLNLVTTFFSLEDLYNDFARPECMWVLCLEMLHLAQFSDVQMIKDHWDMCLFAAIKESVDGQSLSAACSIVRDLGNNFYPNDVSFPMQHLVQRLEEIAAGIWPAGEGSPASSDVHKLIPKTLLEVCGASERLRYVYDTLIERHTTTNVLRLQYLKSVIVVLEFAKMEMLKSKSDFRSTPGILSTRPLREAGLLVELCDKYLLQAQSLSSDLDLNLDDLVSSFERVKNLDK
ncbi:nuclear pore complex protein NUP155 [Chloropicon primus]|nr:nuclear pore complex protein NUP155 [Chloropicon primus]